uniref:C2 domain-containing protein n=1 Tax=Taeniopygia guttata TaxID=59729 RepID=A0A674HLU7_TAEGU
MEDKNPKSLRGNNRDRLRIYSSELEAVPEFEGLQDFCHSFPLCQPGRAPAPVGTFKGLFCIYPVPEEAGAAPAPRCFQRLPPRQPQPCLVRVYIVRAFELSPRDVTGLSDPYVRVALGKKTLGQRDQYVPNTLEPVFGRMFELSATIPLEKDLRVTILDRDKVPPDQEIGSTTIDLENRLLAPCRAHCGLPTRYRAAGPGCWRDQLCPSRALELLAGTRGLPPPRYSRGGTALSLGGHRFELCHFERGHPPMPHSGSPRERLALHVLNLCGLVPEHLETRGLRSHRQPGLEQGKVQMWVDIFPASLGPPGPPVNIDPRKAEGYELRCVVWNVRDTDLGDINLLGQRMSDIYVSGWLDGLPEQRQRTDIHYRSLDGSGAFNWRFVFPFEFLAAEKLCAIRRKEHAWSLDETLLKVPPKLILQVWDNDKLKADDLLGILELELMRLPRPARSARLCRGSPGELPWLSRAWLSVSRAWLSMSRFSRCRLSRGSPLNLFRSRRARGWWPCTLQEEEGGQRLSVGWGHPGRGGDTGDTSNRPGVPAGEAGAQPGAADGAGGGGAPGGEGSGGAQPAPAAARAPAPQVLVPVAAVPVEPRPSRRPAALPAVPRAGAVGVPAAAAAPLLRPAGSGPAAPRGPPSAPPTPRGAPSAPHVPITPRGPPSAPRVLLMPRGPPSAPPTPRGPPPSPPCPPNAPGSLLSPRNAPGSLLSPPCPHNAPGSPFSPRSAPRSLLSPPCPLNAPGSPNPAPDTPNPAQDTSNPAPDTPNPAQDTPKPAQDTPNPAQDTSNPAPDTPNPAQDTPNPAQDTPNPAQGTPNPAPTPNSPQDTPNPAQDTPNPAQDTSNPAPGSSNPAQDTSNSAQDTPNSAPDTPNPAQDASNPAQDTPNPAPTPNSTQDTPNPAPDTPNPAQDTPNPAQDTSNPTQDTPNPAQGTPNPAKDTPNPAQDTPNPAPDTPNPAPETPPHEAGTSQNRAGTPRDPSPWTQA